MGAHTCYVGRNIATILATILALRCTKPFKAHFNLYAGRDPPALLPYKLGTCSNNLVD